MGWYDFVTKFLVKITFLYKLVAQNLDVFVPVQKDRAIMAW